MARIWSRPPFVEFTGLIRKEPIQSTRIVVFSLVDNPAHGIDGDSLVRESAHKWVRNRRHFVFGFHRDFEDISMWLRPARCCACGGLFACEPRAPWGSPAGAVHDRAIDTEKSRTSLGSPWEVTSISNDVQLPPADGSYAVAGFPYDCEARGIVANLVVPD